MILTWTRIKKMQFFALAMALCLSQPACGADKGTVVNEPSAQTNEVSNEQTKSMKIRIKVEDKVLTATLRDSKTTRDFVSQLPLTLVLEDFNKVEKIRVLPKKLSTEGAPADGDSARGDVAYYVPWGNLAIFYKDLASGSDDLIILGKIDSGKEIFNVPGSVEVTIELVD